MTMFTKEEKAWIRQVENLLKRCPPRFGFYCIGDPCLGVYDRNKDDLIENFYAQGDDFIGSLHSADAILGNINFPVAVHATRG